MKIQKRLVISPALQLMFAFAGWWTRSMSGQRTRGWLIVPVFSLLIGCSSARIMLTHIFPNIVNPLLILATLSVGLIILVESALSYLGAGIPPPTATWGSMVSDGRGLIDTAWWISFFPGAAIGMVVLSGNFLGDWLRDRLDPRLRQI